MTAGTAHIAATCGSGITYVTGRDGEWIADRLAAPEGYDERGPQLALDGGHLTLGYSRYAEEDGACGGSNYIDGGVFVRSRSLPDGRWSKPTRIGRREDDLEALRVRGTTVHAVALGNDGDAGL